MSILKIDDKWSVVYDPKSNDSPKMWMRHGDRHYPFDESNAVVAMFYALKEAHEARDEVIARLVEALRWQADQPEAHPFMVLNARAVLAEIEKGGV